VITLHCRNAVLSDVLLAIRRQVSVQLWWGAIELWGRGRVTVDLEHVPLADALTAVLDGHGLEAMYLPPSAWIIRPKMPSAGVGRATVMGAITNRQTSDGVPRATVVIDNIQKVVTDDDGHYRLTNLAAGAHLLTVREVGYRPSTQYVRLGDGSAVALDVALEPTAATLSQIVVTGTVVPTERRAVPNQMTVITGEQLWQRGVHEIDELFRGDVPGLFAVATGNSSDADVLRIYSRGGLSLTPGRPTTAMQVYVDGIALVDPGYLNRIDPMTIDRIEILSGPQASTIYGSGAISGVIQIFTKREKERSLTLDATVLSGMVDGLAGSDISPRQVPQGRASLQLNGADSLTSFALGGRWNEVGAWTPQRTTRDFGLNGALHRQLFSSLSTDVSVTGDQHWIGGGTTSDDATALSGDLASNALNGNYLYDATTAIGGPSVHHDQHTLVSLLTTYAPTSWWSMQLRMGTDDITGVQYTPTAVFVTQSDSFLTRFRTLASKAQMGLINTLRRDVGGWGRTTLVLGLDGWRSTSSNISTTAADNGAQSDLVSVASTRDRVSDVGGFVQWEAAVADVAYLTVGLRGERNSNYGDHYGTDLSPRYALSLVQKFGIVTAKARFAYGRATQPPDPSVKDAEYVTDATFGPHLLNASAPLLGPEYQHGPEGGIELYFGHIASVDITHYDQIVQNLIGRVIVDSARSLLPVSGTETYLYNDIYQATNVGTLRNVGTNVTASVHGGPWALAGTYSKQESILRSYAAPFVALLTTHTVNAYRIGEGALLFPTHLAAASLSYGSSAWRAEVNVQYIGVMPTNDNLVFELAGVARLGVLSPRAAPVPSSFRTLYPSTTTVDVHYLYHLTHGLDALLHIKNIANVETHDIGVELPILGRQAEVGLAWHR
jgi:outer membrane cobalamin receptor